MFSSSRGCGVHPTVCKLLLIFFSLITSSHLEINGINPATLADRILKRRKGKGAATSRATFPCIFFYYIFFCSLSFRPPSLVVDLSPKFRTNCSFFVFFTQAWVFLKCSAFWNLYPNLNKKPDHIENDRV